MNATALIAEDESLLAQALQAELARAWPGLRVVATVGDGDTAVAQALALRPDVLWLDIRMPGQTGLQAAAELADEWPEGVPFPALVFVTAFDAYAVEAFEAQAVDYVLKPVQPAPADGHRAGRRHAGPPARAAGRGRCAGRRGAGAAAGDPGQRGPGHPHGADRGGAGV
jgi:CheY-like chemotaxis protein